MPQPPLFVSLLHRRLPPLLIIVAVAVLTTWYFYPGEPTSDGVEQLRQIQAKQINDWHPPVMTYVWAWLMNATGQVGALYLLHECMFVVGFLLFADGLHRAGHFMAAWLIALVSCFPLFVFYNHFVIKDVGMASAFIVAVSLPCWFWVQSRALPWWALLVALLCLIYGALLRINAIFALGPLLLFLSPYTRKLNVYKLLPACLMIAVLMHTLADFVNHKVLGAERLDVMQQLQIFDLMGIEARSADTSVWGNYDAPLDEVRKCFTPVWWDNFSNWGTCSWIRPKIGQLGNQNPPNVIEERGQLWRAAILKHPLTYMLHRVSYFNSSLYFFVPAFHQGRYMFPEGQAVPGNDYPTPSRIRFDYLRVNFLMWPVTWLAMGCLALVGIHRFGDHSLRNDLSKAMIISALLYAAGYFVIGIGTDLRYYYWSVMAIVIGCVASFDSVVALVRDRRGSSRLAVVTAVSVIVLGYTARLADVPLF